MRITVSVGWAIYHLGYLFGTLTSAADPKLLNVIYNVADIVNKICSSFRTGLGCVNFYQLVATSRPLV